MAALIPDERYGVLIFDFFLLANQNTTGYIKDKCCHLQGDGAPWLIFLSSRAKGCRMEPDMRSSAPKNVV